MRILYSFACESAEPRENRLDVHGIFQELFAPGFPAAHKMVYVLGVEWESEPPGRRHFKIDMVDPHGTPSFTIQGHTEVSARREGEPPPRTVLILPIDDIRFPVEGTYYFHLRIGNGEPLTLQPLHLIEAEID